MADLTPEQREVVARGLTDAGHPLPTDVYRAEVEAKIQKVADECAASGRFFMGWAKFLAFVGVVLALLGVFEIAAEPRQVLAEGIVALFFAGLAWITAHQ